MRMPAYICADTCRQEVDRLGGQRQRQYHVLRPDQLKYDSFLPSLRLCVGSHASLCDWADPRFYLACMVSMPHATVLDRVSLCQLCGVSLRREAAFAAHRRGSVFLLTAARSICSTVAGGSVSRIEGRFGGCFVLPSVRHCCVSALALSTQVSGSFAGAWFNAPHCDGDSALGASVRAADAWQRHLARHLEAG